MIRSVRASLDYCTKQFGPYEHGYVGLVEHPGHGYGLHAESTTITYEEGFSLLRAKAYCNIQHADGLGLERQRSIAEAPGSRRLRGRFCIITRNQIR